MPTNHDETLHERYVREHQAELEIYARMTPEQISEMAQDLHNALAQRDAALSEIDHMNRVASVNSGELYRARAERDAALAELAALKGGREAVAWQVSHPGVAGGWKSYERYPNWADGDPTLTIRPLYTTPPAQASAWVPVSERLPSEDQGTVAVLTEEGDTLTAWASYWSGARTDFACWTFPHDDDGDSVVTHWMPLPAAPAWQGAE